MDDSVGTKLTGCSVKGGEGLLQARSTRRARTELPRTGGSEVGGTDIRHFKEYRTKGAIMKRHVLLAVLVALGLSSVMMLFPVCQAAETQAKKSKNLVPPVVFQAAGPTADSIEGTVDEFRAALGEPQQRQCGRAAHNRSARDQLGWRWGCRRNHRSRHAVQCFPEHSRRPIHDTWAGPFAGSPIGRARRMALQVSSLIRPMAPRLAPLALCAYSPR